MVRERINAGVATMNDFLNGWLIERRFEAVEEHFQERPPVDGAPVRSRERGASPDPGGYGRLHFAWNDGIREIYWNWLEDVRPAPGPGEDNLYEVLGPPRPDVIEGLRLSPDKYTIIQETPFTVFIAETAEAVDDFAGQYGYSGAELDPDRNLVLGMIADFAAKGDDTYGGPLTTFWIEDVDSPRWYAANAAWYPWAVEAPAPRR